MIKYYRLRDDLSIPNRWFLGEVNFDGKWDFWNYVRAGEVKLVSKQLEIRIRAMGFPLDFTMADFELLIVNQKVAEVFGESDVQLIPIYIETMDTDNNHYLMVIKKELDCIDEAQSEYIVWEEGNAIRPDLAGQYKTFYKLRVDPKKIDSNCNIFRVKNYNQAIIVSEKVRDNFEKKRINGAEFVEV